MGQTPDSEAALSRAVGVSWRDRGQLSSPTMPAAPAGTVAAVVWRWPTRPSARRVREKRVPKAALASAAVASTGMDSMLASGAPGCSPAAFNSSVTRATVDGSAPKRAPNSPGAR